MEKDYFQAEFLLTLPTSGYYSVHVETRLLDNEGKVWQLGHKVKMNVVVESEENLRLLQKQQESVLQSSAGGGSGGGGGGGKRRGQLWRT